MITSLQLHLSKIFLKIFLRNRQAILFSLFFPLIFIGAFSFSGSEPQPFLIGVEDKSNSPFSSKFIENLEQEDLFTLINGDFENLKPSGNQSFSLILLLTEFHSSAWFFLWKFWNIITMGQTWRQLKLFTTNFSEPLALKIWILM